VSLVNHLDNGTDSLVIVLDGVSKDNFDYYYHNGFLPNISNYFQQQNTGSVISTFPALTGPAHCSFLGLEHPSGYEALRFIKDQNKLENTYPRNIFLRDILGINIPQSIALNYDYSKDTLRHLLTFMNPESSIRKDSHHIKCKILESQQDQNSIWFLGTDELTHRRGLSGLLYALQEIDQTFKEIMKELKPREVLLFSDHGNHARDERLERSNLEDNIKNAGFNLSNNLFYERDVVMPSFGMISFAAVYTNKKNIPELATVLLENDKVDFISYLNENQIIVKNKKGKSHLKTKYEFIEERPKFKYNLIEGEDPLHYQQIFQVLCQQGLADLDGFVDEKTLFLATKDHYYPNALPRLQGAFFQNKSPGDILISLKNGYYNGKKNLEKIIDIYSTHGNLTASSSTGFSLYTGPKHLPTSSMVYELQGFSQPKNNNRGLRGLYNRFINSLKRKK